jgi:4-hydroxy-4-methyl-2-oxoglutarate aldolase
MSVDNAIARLGELGAATVHEAQGGTGALDSAIKPLDPDTVLAGRALTVSSAPADNLAIQYAATIARPGDVLVVDAKGYREAGAWGDVLTAFAQHRGIAGLVIDGAVRDRRAIVEANFPVFARGLSIKGTGKFAPGGVNVPISCGGAAVRPGDVVVGDADGVVIVDGGAIEEVLARSEAREAKELAFRKSFAEGRTPLELMGLQERLAPLGYR